MKAISFENVWEKYRIKFVVDHQEIWEDYWALQGVTFEVAKGEALCLIGENGSGKSTILRLIAGILTPDRGLIEKQGRVSALLDLGAGFHPEFTGRDNIYATGSLFGLNKTEIDAKIDQITEFAGVGRFIDAQVKAYSQGMLVRLGFAIAIHIEPDILLVDDTLAVGDEDYQKKCLGKILELKEKGKTIVVVTHSLGLAKQICQRGILLREGKIIRDGRLDKLIPFYLETIGNKRGLALAKRADLSVIFNNGGLFINWKDFAIVKHFGCYTAFLYQQCKYFSNQARWEIKLNQDGKIVALGKWLNLPLRQEIEVDLLAERTISLKIDLIIDQDIEIGYKHTGFMIDEKFSEYITLEQKNYFPEDFFSEVNWQPIKDNVHNLVGLINKAENIQTIIEVPDNLHQDIMQLQNSGRDLSARVIEVISGELLNKTNLPPGRYRYFTGKISIFDEIDKFEQYLTCFKQDLQESRTIKKMIKYNNLKIYFEDKSIKIYRQEQKLTCRFGVDYKFYCLGQEFSLTNAHWKISKLSAQKMKVEVWWEPLPLLMEWIWEIETENIIQIKALMRVKQELVIKRREIHFYLSNKYEQWFTQEEEGAFEDFVSSSKNSMVKLKNNKNIILGVKSCTTAEESLPGVLIDLRENNFKGIANLCQDFWENQKGTMFSICQVDFAAENRLLPGDYQCFQSRMVTLETDEEKRYLALGKQQVETAKRSAKIEKGPLSLFFEEGKGKIFWKGTQLTKDLGLYTSVFSGGWWCDSGQAEWRIEKKNFWSLEATGFWPKLPLSQKWKLSLVNNYMIKWEIQTSIYEEIEIKEEQVNLMISNLYTKWLADFNQQGQFFDYFVALSEFNWPRIWAGPVGDNSIISAAGSRKNSLPLINFGCYSSSQGSQASIGNSDCFYQARFFRYERLNSGKKVEYSPGQVEYFSGFVEIVPHWFQPLYMIARHYKRWSSRK